MIFEWFTDPDAPPVVPGHELWADHFDQAPCGTLTMGHVVDTPDIVFGAGYVCTREAGHDGWHVAHGAPLADRPWEVVAVWEPGPGDRPATAGTLAQVMRDLALYDPDTGRG